MPKELTTEVVRGCLYTWMLIGRLDGRTPLEITLITSLKMHLLDKQNDVRYLVLFPTENNNNNNLSAFCLKQVKLFASRVSKIFLKNIILLTPLADNFTYFKQNALHLVFYPWKQD